MAVDERSVERLPGRSEEMALRQDLRLPRRRLPVDDTCHDGR